MIQANELRIGNYIYHSMNAQHIKTVVVDPYIIKEIWQNPHKDRFEPIPLTESLLLKLGTVDEGGWKQSFRPHDTPWTWMATIREQVELEIWAHDNTFTMSIYKRWYNREDHEVDLCDISSLHQLQNLYFSLSGRELVFNPNPTL